MSDFILNFELHSIDSLIKNLESVPSVKIMRKPMNTAKNKCVKAYAKGATDGNTDYSVRVYGSQAKNYVKLTASGEDVGFLEFGAGATVATDDPFVEQVGYTVDSASWSATHPSTNPHTVKYWSHGYWLWGETRDSQIPYTEIEPTLGMQQALDHMNRQGLNEIIHHTAKWITSGKV